MKSRPRQGEKEQEQQEENNTCKCKVLCVSWKPNSNGNRASHLHCSPHIKKSHGQDVFIIFTILQNIINASERALKEVFGIFFQPLQNSMESDKLSDSCNELLMRS